LNSGLVPPYQFIFGISDPNLRVPYTEVWNVAVDYGLAVHNTLTFAYVGNEGKRLLFTGTYDLTGINPTFTQLEFTSNASASNYNALQVMDQAKLARAYNL
jgi:hypothetical protein